MATLKRFKWEGIPHTEISPFAFFNRQHFNSKAVCSCLPLKRRWLKKANWSIWMRGISSPLNLDASTCTTSRPWCVLIYSLTEVTLNNKHSIPPCSLEAGNTALGDPSETSNMKRHSEGTFSNDYSKYLEDRRAQDFVQWLITNKRSGWVFPWSDPDWMG